MLDFSIRENHLTLKDFSVIIVTTEKVSFNADSRRLHANGRRFSRRSNLRVSALDWRKSAFKKGFSALTIIISLNLGL